MTLHPWRRTDRSARRPWAGIPEHGEALGSERRRKSGRETELRHPRLPPLSTLYSPRNPSNSRAFQRLQKLRPWPEREGPPEAAWPLTPHTRSAVLLGMYKPGDVLGIQGETKQWRVEIVIGVPGAEPLVRYRMLGQDGVVAEWVATAAGAFSRRNPDGTLEAIEVIEVEVLSKG